MKLSFQKMHGIGNDFVIVDAIESAKIRKLSTSTLSALAKKICHRRFGVGADQLLVLYPSRRADFRMRIFNADGGEVEMCGNGIRCLSAYVWGKRYSRKRIISVETLAGVITPEKRNGLIRVDMGAPILDGERIPVHRAGRMVNEVLRVRERTFRITTVSMGNPHAVIFVANLDTFPVSEYGPIIEHHDLFPRRINVEFIEIINSHELRMRVWERGAGETLACGTGASAAVVASVLNGKTDRKVLVHLLGGDLLIEWADDDHVFMTGPAEKVYDGMIEL